VAHDCISFQCSWVGRVASHRHSARTTRKSAFYKGGLSQKWRFYHLLTAYLSSNTSSHNNIINQHVFFLRADWQASHNSTTHRVQLPATITYHSHRGRCCAHVMSMDPRASRFRRIRRTCTSHTNRPCTHCTTAGHASRNHVTSVSPAHAYTSAIIDHGLEALRTHLSVTTALPSV
jgi:hypothetical protein